ncbi:MAG TPA: hypothetical protein PL009_11955 [Flavipsychrobacter sp.]|nr:hypothetical protein [Flavipsychrobacter sp.]
MKSIKYAPALALAALLSLGFTGCIIDNDDDYYNPNPHPPATYQQSFDEDFDKDTRGWTFDDRADSSYAFVANGYYKMVDFSRLGSNHVAVVSTGANTAKNFSIKTRMSTDNAMGLIFGASSNTYGYSLFIDAAGYYAVYKEGANPDAVISWTQSANIKNGWNDVEVEQVADYWYFYINGVKVNQTPARVLGGSEMGFMVLSNTTGQADYLTVRW